MTGYCSFHSETIGRGFVKIGHVHARSFRDGLWIRRAARLVAALEGGRGESGEKHSCGTLGPQSPRQKRVPMTAPEEGPLGGGGQDTSGTTHGSIFLHGFACVAEMLCLTEALNCIFWNCTTVPRLGRGSGMPLPQSAPRGVPELHPLRPVAGPPCP